MDTFTAHRLRFIAEAQEPIELNEHQGSAIRGALFHALRNRFCANKEADECAGCPLVAACPVATLVSTLNPASSRGRDVPRPFTIQPPLTPTASYPAGARLEFGLTLYAQALQLFPYVVLAVNEFERGGIGRLVQQANGRRQRGRLTIREVWAENPLTGARQSVLGTGDKMVHVPDVPITHRQIMEQGARSREQGANITLCLLTPTRLIERAVLVKPETFRFQPLFQRLMERLESLSRDFSDTPLVFDDPRGLIEAAGRVRTVENQLTWEELRSYSTRRQAESPTSGLLGSVTFEAEDWSPFWPWLAWGQFTHVGKDAVKGNGWYRMEEQCQSYNTSS